MTAPDPRIAACRARLDEMQRDAEAATPGPWWLYLGVHGDPVVVTDQTRPAFTNVCTGSKAPDDYGRATACHIAAWSPSVALSTITLLRGLLDRTEERLGRHRALGSRQVERGPGFVGWDTIPTCSWCAWCGIGHDRHPCPDAAAALADLDALSGQLGVTG